MNEQQTHDPRFDWIKAHGGPAVSWAETSGRRREVEGAGLIGWWAFDWEFKSDSLELSKHIEEAHGIRMLTVCLHRHQPEPGAAVRWESTLLVNEGQQRYVRCGGVSPDFPTAVALAEGHVNQSRQIGSLTWWQEAETRFVGWLGPFSFKAWKVTSEATEEAPYWRVEANVEAPTLEEAATLAGLLAR